MINRILSISLFTFFSIVISAQTFSYTLIDEPIVDLECVLDTDVSTIVHGTVTNLLSENNDLTWVRYEKIMPEGWESNICDINSCYLANTGERQFTLESNQSGAMDLHLHTNGFPGDSAVITVCIFETADTTQIICHTYKFFCEPVSNESVVLDQLSIYPNPAREFIQIENPYLSQSDQVKIELVNMNGQILKSEYATGGNTSVSTSDLPTGSYIVRVSSDLRVVNRRVMLR